MRFIKPTPDEVTNYARKIGFILDGNQFCDFYESKGWMVGKSPMKVWQAAVSTWQAKEPRAARWGAPKPTQAPPDVDKVKAAQAKMEAIKEREFQKRELARLAQERDDARSRRMMESTGERIEDETPKKLYIPAEIKRCRDENGNQWIGEMERRGADEE